LPMEGRLQDPAPLPLLTGGFRWRRGRQHSALVLIPAGERQPIAAIDKHRLVPLGEWLPEWISATPGLSAVGGLEPGAPSRFLRWSGPPAAVAICYEISNGAALAQAVAEGAQWLLTIANLDPYPVLLQRQFLALAQLRSVETARPLLSAANTGPTAAVSAAGEVNWLLPSGAAAMAIAPLGPADGLSAYVRWREAPLGLLTLLAALVWLRQRLAGSGPRPAAVPPRRTRPPDQG
jgi:apolipoprotein N-acyltransferase